jgi:hypothetical protein
LNQDEVEVTFKLPKSAVDFIDLLSQIRGQTREDVFRDTIRGELNLALDDPISEWNQKHLREQYGLEPFLSEDS